MLIGGWEGTGVPEQAIGRHRRRPRIDRLRPLLPYIGMLALIGLIFAVGTGLAAHDHHGAAPGGAATPDAGTPGAATPGNAAAQTLGGTGSPLRKSTGVPGANRLGAAAPHRPGVPGTSSGTSRTTSPGSASSAARPSGADSSASTAPSGGGVPAPTVSSGAPPTASAGERIIAEARVYLGVPYVSGGASPSGFDGAGYTMWVYARASVASLPHDAEGQRRSMREISMDEARPGDLIFHMSRGRADGVAIYAGDGRQYAAEPGSSVQLERAWSSHIRVGTDWH